MNFRKGDLVKFLNDVGQGTIVKFQDEKIALVLNEDGFEIPVLISELLKIEGDYTFNNNEEQSSGNTASSKPQNIVIEEDDLEEDGLNTDSEAKVYFALVPKNQEDMISSDLDVYLINDSNFRVSYAISKSEDKFQSLFAYGNLEDNTKVILESIKREDLNKFEELNFQLLFFRKGNYFLLNPINKTWTVKPARFFKQSAFTENDFFHENAFIYTLTTDEINLDDHISDSDIEQSKKNKDQKEPRKRLKSSKSGENKGIEEVDLHIEELVEDYSKLSNSEMLDIQMSRFATTLDGGIIAGTRKMVFIHGLGNGRLKHEVAKTLNRKYPKLKYQDASFKEYGYGATMVIIK
ncbi:MAG: DUF2027 domain-containing protein [Bacteroidales bacterium]|nr:DUF2027 domain-containing protein [Bacteroidales bacterium]